MNPRLVLAGSNDKGLLTISDRAVERLAYVVAANRKILAVTGAGLSSNSGGPSWKALVKHVINQTVKHHRAFANSREDSKNKLPLRRLVADEITHSVQLLDGYLHSLGSETVKAPDDLQVALGVCANLLENLRRANVRSNEFPHVPTVYEIIAGLFDDPDKLDELWIYHAFPAQDEELIVEAVRKLGANHVPAPHTRLVAQLTNVPWLQDKLADLSEEKLGPYFTVLRKPYSDGFYLTVDERSSLIPLFYSLENASRSALIERATAVFVGQGNESVSQMPGRYTESIAINPAATLAQKFSIRRAITLNYDWELEKVLLLDQSPLTWYPRSSVRQVLAKYQAESPVFDERLGSTQYRPAGDRPSTTEYYVPSAAASLFEFALNSPSSESHIVHLHGRADVPADIVATIADYDRIYRNGSGDPRSLERALDVALTGNPTLIVGVGLREPEVLRAFQIMRANDQLSQGTPAVALIAQEETHLSAEQERVRHYQRHGLYIIHYGAPEKAGMFALATHLRRLERLAAALKPLRTNAKAMEATTSAVISAVTIEAVTGATSNWNERFSLLYGKTWRTGDAKILNAIQIDIQKLLRQLSVLAKPPSREDLTLLDKTSRLAEGAIRYIEALRSRLLSAALDNAVSALADEIFAAVAWSKKAAVGRETVVTDFICESNVDQFSGGYHRAHHFRGAEILERKDPLSFSARSNDKGECPKQLQPIAISVAMRLVPASDRPNVEDIHVFLPRGSGKSTLLRSILAKVAPKEGESKHFRNSLIVNLGFTLELESVISQVSKFLQIAFDVWDYGQNNKLERIEAICSGALSSHENSKSSGCKSLLALIGLERLFGNDGKPIATDLIRLIAAVSTRRPSNLRVMIFATPVVQNWLAFRGWSVDFNGNGKRFVLDKDNMGLRLCGRWRSHARRHSVYSTDLKIEGGLGFRVERLIDANRQLFERTRESRAQRELVVSPPTSNRSLNLSAMHRERRAHDSTIVALLDNWPEYVFFWYRSQSQQRQVDRSEAHRVAAIDRALMELLSIVGAPMELEVAFHDSRLMAAVQAADVGADTHAILAESAMRLGHSGFAAVIGARYSNTEVPPKLLDGEDRYCLHRSILLEIRERLGIPHGNASLSNTFNLSIAGSLSTDVIVPSFDILQRLTTLVEEFTFAWKDLRSNDPKENGATAALNEAARATIVKGSPEASALASMVQQSVLVRELRDAIARPSISYCLRAAANILRSFFSAASIVTLHPVSAGPGASATADLDAQKRRIQQLVDQIKLVTCPEDLQGSSALIDLEPAIAAAGADCAELLKAVTQSLEIQKHLDSGSIESKAVGDYKGASLNRRVPPPLYGGELVWLHNERATIALIQGDLYEAEFSLNRAFEAVDIHRGTDRGNFRNRIDVNRALLLIERGSLREADACLDAVHGDLLCNRREDATEIRPIVTGYRAFISQLSGQNDLSRKYFQESLAALVETKQMRAHALFCLRYSALLSRMLDHGGALQAIESAIHSADASGQLDVLWRARLQKLGINGYDREATAVTERALEYARVTRNHRVVVDALMHAAKAAGKNANYGFAADLTSRAMVEANRNGMTLRKISLRINMGKIMLARADMNGERLVVQAMAHADKIGYQAAVQQAQEALLEYKPSVDLGQFSLARGGLGGPVFGRDLDFGAP